MSEMFIMIVILIISVILHEIAHGYAAWKLGDPTAKLQGRLSLNPLVHLDPMMSVILPGLLLVSGSSILFGAAKPVPYNPYNFTDQKYGEAKVAIAGPLANIAIALFFAALIQIAPLLGLSLAFVKLATSVIILNLFLAFFNLLPFPPLDGSKILPVLLPASLKMSYNNFRYTLERNVGLAFLILFGLIFLGLTRPLAELVFWCTSVLIG